MTVYCNHCQANTIAIEDFCCLYCNRPLGRPPDPLPKVHELELAYLPRKRAKQRRKARARL